VTDANDVAGHRRRLRERFGQSGLAGFLDYEIVELLLTFGTPRRDCKRQAKEAIKRHRTLAGVLAASVDELQEVPGITAQAALLIKLVREVSRECLKEQVLHRPLCRSSREVFDYLYHSMRDLKKEVFKVMFMDSQNQVIGIEDLFEGTLNASAVYPREIIEKAIRYNAASLIFVHNHPTGNPEPSENDRQITWELVFAGSIMQMKVLDHIVIGGNRYFSFADAGLVEEYEGDYLSFRKARGDASGMVSRPGGT